MWKATRKAIAPLLFAAACSTCLWSYSVLTHEEIVDIAWKDQIQPLLLKHFPAATEDDLRQAHGYAYGGCVLQDMGVTPSAVNFSATLSTTCAAAISSRPCSAIPPA